MTVCVTCIDWLTDQVAGEAAGQGVGWEEQGGQLQTPLQGWEQHPHQEVGGCRVPVSWGPYVTFICNLHT